MSRVVVRSLSEIEATALGPELIELQRIGEDQARVDSSRQAVLERLERLCSLIAGPGEVVDMDRLEVIQDPNIPTEEP